MFLLNLFVALLERAQNLEELVVGQVGLAGLSDLLHDLAEGEQRVAEGRNPRRVLSLQGGTLVVGSQGGEYLQKRFVDEVSNEVDLNVLGGGVVVDAA